MQSEADIIKGCISGNKKAQKMLYKKFASSMLGICMRYCKDKSEAEDILQEGFLKVYGSIEKFKNEGSFEGWIKRIMVNTALNHFRDNAKHNNKIEIEEIENLYYTNISVLDKFSEKDLLKLIQALPDGYRMVFNLYVIEGYSHKEIADMMNISESTSKSQLSRARLLLQSKIAKRKEEKILSFV